MTLTSPERQCSGEQDSVVLKLTIHRISSHESSGWLFFDEGGSYSFADQGVQGACLHNLNIPEHPRLNPEPEAVNRKAYSKTLHNPKRPEHTLLTRDPKQALTGSIEPYRTLLKPFIEPFTEPIDEPFQYVRNLPQGSKYLRIIYSPKS